MATFTNSSQPPTWGQPASSFMNPEWEKARQALEKVQSITKSPTKPVQSNPNQVQQPSPADVYYQHYMYYTQCQYMPPNPNMGMGGAPRPMGMGGPPGPMGMGGPARMNGPSFTNFSQPPPPPPEENDSPVKNGTNEESFGEYTPNQRPGDSQNNHPINNPRGQQMQGPRFQNRPRQPLGPGGIRFSLPKKNRGRGAQNMNQRFQSPRGPRPNFDWQNKRGKSPSQQQNDRSQARGGMGGPGSYRQDSGETSTRRDEADDVFDSRSKQPVNSEKAAVAAQGEWPPSLRDYVQRAFSSVSDTDEKDKMETVLKELLTDVFSTGKAWSTDWSREPLPLVKVQPSQRD